jgi:rod shape-determining protein MreB and related proteins
VRVGGDKMDESIMSFVKRKYNLMIGERTAEQIKITCGSAYPMNNIAPMEVKGRDLISGIPKGIMISEEEVREALHESVCVILETVKVTLENAPPELAADIVDRGIVLAGGGALLKGLDILIREHTGVPVIVPDDPLTAVVRGCGLMLDKLEMLKKVALATN